ncbi:hypothetical protein [Ornithinibacillus sp. 179-J 7C1 HS]|uniref:hypothetical protein n=1 Tax=Ornithinibacillus sp. 179-J 7C1 HS TaxID=3142384 RepID=UPI0039A37B6A
MRINKNVILIIFIIAFFVSATYFIEPAESEDVIPDLSDEEELNMLEEMYSELHSDYLNIHYENENLKQEMFEMKKNILESNLLSNFLPHPESTEILHKKLEENKISVFYKDEIGNHLMVSSKKPSFDGNIKLNSLNPKDGFNWEQVSYSSYILFGGSITNNQIEKVQVKQGYRVYEADILKINDNHSAWYSIFVKESTSNEPETIKIEALDKNGIILWEESFEDNFDG